MYLQKKRHKYLAKVLIIILLSVIYILYFLIHLYFNNITYIIQQSSQNNVEDNIVVSEVDGYTGRFPDIVQADNYLIAAYYWNNSHAPYVLGDSLGTIQLKYGELDGNKWSSEPIDFINEQFLIDNHLGVWKDDEQYYYSQDEAKKHNAQFCVEARDPNFAVMGNKIIFTFFTRLPWDSNLGEHTYYRYDENYDYTYGRTYIMYSDDMGITWNTPVEIECKYLDRGCAKRGNIAILDENKILIPLYGYNHKLESTFTTANVLAVLKNGKWEFQEEYSVHQEDGLSADGAFKKGVTEVSFTMLEGNIYALSRPDGEVMYSKDKGKTWETIKSPENETIILHQPSLETISESRQILASWAEPNKTGGRDIYLSLFKPGKSGQWSYSDKYCIYNNINAGDMGDPTSIYLPKQKVLTIYYDVQKGIIACTSTKLTKTK